MDSNFLHYAKVLAKVGLILFDKNSSQALITEEGRKALQLGSYALLGLSYYNAFAHLPELHNGELTYGFTGNVNRQQTANAISSNGILGIKVAPAIVALLSTSEVIAEYREGQKLATVDYGSGGGDMTRMMLTSDNVEFGYGMDISQTATQTATQLSAQAGVSETSKFIVGDITKPSDFNSLRDQLGGKKAVHTINFILHESPELADAFLANFAGTFGDQPLIITETLRIPDEALRAHPNSQAPSFYYMHEISGQTLYKLDQLKEMLAKHGLEIVDKRTHSSMRDEDNNSRAHDYIVSFVVRKKK